MLLQGSWVESIQVIPTAAIGIILISGGMERYFWKIGKIKFFPSALLVLSGILLGVSETTTDILGVVITVILLSVLTLRKKRIHSGVAA